jgi:hypothetical protein
MNDAITASGTPDRRRPMIDRYVDIMSVLLLSATAVLSALCVYQSALWSGQETRLYNQTSADRISAALAGATSNEMRVIDAVLFVRYLEALRARDKTALTFFNEHFRPEARAALAAWLRTDPLHNPHAPRTPFEMPEYQLTSDSAMRRDNTLAERTFATAEAANRHANAFVSLTVMFAAVAFLAGMSTKFRFPFHLIVVSIGIFVLIYGIIRLSALPFVSSP